MVEDLKNKIPEDVVKNQSPPFGERIHLLIDGLLHEYFHDDDLFIVKRLVNKMRSELGWFETISSHGPSVGDFYEALLKSSLHEIIPSSLKVGTGFIYDSECRFTSPQIDLIIYKDSEKPPIYKRSDFVIIDSKSVVSCTEVKKTLTTSILKTVIRNYINSNLGMSPLAPRGIQFLNIFTFYSKISIEKIASIILNELTNFLNQTEVETKGGNKGYLFLEHLVLPNVFFLDRTGFISTNCFPISETQLKIVISINRSSLEGHSLGEFLVSARSFQSEQKISEKNFLTYPLIMPEKQLALSKEISVWKKFTMDDLIELYPVEIGILQKISTKDKRPYGAYISSSITNLSGIKLHDLEKSNGFKWLTINNGH